jgi:hypothetical protein
MKRHRPVNNISVHEVYFKRLDDLGEATDVFEGPIVSKTWNKVEDAIYQVNEIMRAIQAYDEET